MSDAKKYFSNILTGKNIGALIESVDLLHQILSETAFKTGLQLNISTASKKYLDIRLAEKNFYRPPLLGISDDIFRNVGISAITTQQTVNALHEILKNFYGITAVCAFVKTTKAAPFSLQNQDDLIVSTAELGQLRFVFYTQDFKNIDSVSAHELSAVLNAYAKKNRWPIESFIEKDHETNEEFVVLYNTSKGPTSNLTLLGGKAQLALQFDKLHNTELPVNTTVWQITKHNNNIIRFRWAGGPKPKLLFVNINDIVLLYGTPFANANPNFFGSFKIINVSPPGAAPSFDTGWFEINLDVIELLNSMPNMAPPPNTPTETYSYLVNQVDYNDIRFMPLTTKRPLKTTRFASAIEPGPRLLKIIIPATTESIRRNILSAGYVNEIYHNDSINQFFGHNSDPQKQLEIINEYTVRIKSEKLDILAHNGILKYGLTTKKLARVYRENGFLYFVTQEPHQIVGYNEYLTTVNYVPNQTAVYGGILWRAILPSGPGFGGAQIPTIGSVYWDFVEPTQNLTNTVIQITDVVLQKKPNYNNSYVWHPKSNFTLGQFSSKILQTISANSSVNSIYVDGEYDSNDEYFLLNLNHDLQEGPIKINNKTFLTANFNNPIEKISQINNIVTVKLSGFHYLLPDKNVQITGTVNFNGIWTVLNVIDNHTFTFFNPLTANVLETSGNCTTIVTNIISILFLEESYIFKYEHVAGSSINSVIYPTGYKPKIQATDRSIYLVDTAAARDYCESILKNIIAAGTPYKILVKYPDDLGLGFERKNTNLAEPGPHSEAASYVWRSAGGHVL